MVIIDRETSTPYYLQLKNQFKDLILSGVLKAGTKLPPTRNLAGELALNRNTVLTAYEELEADGLVRSHVGQGTFVAEPTDFGLPAPRVRPAVFNWPGQFSQNIDDNALNSLVHLYRLCTDRVQISFAGGLPPADLYPTSQLLRSFHDILREGRNEVFSYGPIEGYLPLREQLAHFMRDHEVEAGPTEIFITNGSQQALAIACRILLEPGDFVLAEEPTYTGALSIFRAAKARVLGIPMEKDGLNLNVLENYCRTHDPKLLYTIPSFQNPTGRTLSLEKRKRLMSLVERFKIPVIEDDAFSDLRYDGEDMPPLKAFDRCGQVIYLNSMSKKLMPGLRIGWAVIHPDLRDRFVALKGIEDLGTSTVTQAMLSKFIARGYLKSHLRRVRRAYRERRDALMRGIRRHFPASAEVSKPQGGLFCWVSFPEGVDLAPVWEASARRGIGVSPGSLFYASGRGRNAMRLSFTLNPPEKIEAGLRTLGKLLAPAVAHPAAREEEPEKIPVL